MIAYIESSAAAKLIVLEPETPAVRRYLESFLTDDDAHLVSCALLETELRRAATRENLPQATVTALLDHVDVFDLTRSSFTQAGILPAAQLRSLDALHIAAALHIEADVLLTYDARQANAAVASGLRVVSPR